MSDQEARDYLEQLKYTKKWVSSFPVEAAEIILELEKNKKQLEQDKGTHEQILNDQLRKIERLKLQIGDIREEKNMHLEVENDLLKQQIHEMSQDIENYLDTIEQLQKELSMIDDVAFQLKGCQKGFKEYRKGAYALIYDKDDEIESLKVKVEEAYMIGFEKDVQVTK